MKFDEDVPGIVSKGADAVLAVGMDDEAKPRVVRVDGSGYIKSSPDTIKWHLSIMNQLDRIEAMLKHRP